MTCHAIGGAGGTLGPDFTSIGASAPIDYLIDSLLQPGKQIKEGFHVVMVTKKDGTVAAGKLAFENETTITLQDPADQLIDISKSDIQSQEMSPVSLMPPGLTATLRRDEFADLIKFMSELGKEGDFKVGPERLVRTFRYLDDKDGDRGYADMVRHKPMVFVTGNDPRMIWLPGYSKTNGEIPLEELPQLRRQGRENFHYIKFLIDVKSPGNAILNFNSAEELRVFVGVEEVENVGENTLIHLEQGVQPIVVAAHAWKREDKLLRIEVLDADSDSAQFQVVYGK
jgi:putative heme-binding domain-containing protein